MKFSTAQAIESVCWEMKLADMPRSKNRALIDMLFNGNPPYTPAEVSRNRITNNVNFLESTQIAHNARRQFSNAFLKPGNFFSVRLDSGPIHKRQEWSEIITQQINRLMKKSLHYRETLRNVFAQVAVHGVGPAVWSSDEGWVPDMQMMSDVFIPSQTLLTMDNLPYFAIYRRYTAEQLWQKTQGPNVDKAWNMDVVKSCIKWAYDQWGQTNSANDTIYNPEKLQEDFKADSGVYASDAVPTINCFDFYYLSDDEKDYGWRRKIVLDSPGISETNATVNASTKNFLGGRGQFLFDSGERKYADSLSEIIHFQFADGSVVAPFRYHSVRGLGFLLYSVCHLQNRLRNSFNGHVFESLLQYFRVNNPEDAERLTKIDLIDKGIIPEGVQFVPLSDRWQVDGNLIGTAMQMNRQSMEDSSSSSTQDFNFAKDNVEKTATQYTGEANATSAMVGSMLQEAYGYQEFQYQEICRRFCIPNSQDKDAKKFRVECLSRGVPEQYLEVGCWSISAERIIGSGNKQLEIAQVQMLMQNFNRFDPDAQRLILRDFAFSVVDDAAKADLLVPFKPAEVTSAKSFAQVSLATIMMGLPVSVPPGVNRIDIVETWLGEMAAIISFIEQTTQGMATQQQIMGLTNLSKQITQQIQIIAQDPEEKARVKEYADDLSKMDNVVRAYGQRLQQQQAAEAQQGGEQGASPEAQSKIVSAAITAQAMAKIKAEQAAQKQEQKQAAFEADQARKQQAHQLQSANTIRSAQVDEAATDLKTAGEIQRQANQPEPVQ